jgi:hypothetical protein
MNAHPASGAKKEIIIPRISRGWRRRSSARASTKNTIGCWRSRKDLLLSSGRDNALTKPMLSPHQCEVVLSENLNGGIISDLGGDGTATERIIRHLL